MFHPFKKPLADTAIPQLFTCPFCYTPHPLAKEAANEVMQYLSGMTAWHPELQKGKMFGVLAVQDMNGELGYVAAFSGNIAGKGCQPFFVPPIFDTTNPDGYFKAEERRISELNRQIGILEADSNFTNLQQQISTMQAKAETEIAQGKALLLQHRHNRELRRLEPLTESQKAELVRQSQFEKAELKRLERRWSDSINRLTAELSQYTTRTESLKSQRKLMSEALQHWLFEQYILLNAKGEKKTINQIFSEARDTIPPAATGECAAPKMLQYAFANRLKPIAMAEFWWGESPIGETRRHGMYYPACHSKCEPILEFMLQGINVEPNPLKQGQNLQLEILYDDKWMAAVDKPAGMLSVPGKESSDNVYSRVRQMYPDADGPLIVHRLDMSTSGILLIAKTKDMHRLLQRLFATRSIRKRYVALLQGIPQRNEGAIDLPMRPNPDDRPRQVVDFEHGKPATTKYRVEGTDNGITRISFYPETGRTHQLRVHAAHKLGLNCPILGDNLYGQPGQRLFLHAAEIAFTHPVTHEDIVISAKDQF